MLVLAIPQGESCSGDRSRAHPNQPPTGARNSAHRGQSTTLGSQRDALGKGRETSTRGGDQEGTAIGPGGFEPPPSVPKTDVLPLDDGPVPES